MNMALLDLSIPQLDKDQLKLFEYSRLRAVNERSLDVRHAITTLGHKSGQRVIGIDIGGDKAVTQLFTISKEGLIPDEAFSDFRQDANGVGYVESLKRTAQFAHENNIPVGISIGVPLKGSKPDDAKKLPNLHKDLAAYSSDFSVLIPNLRACLNDGPAGVVSGTIHANLASVSEVDQVVFIINGGGIGAAIYQKGKIVSTEAGHTIPVSPRLNTYNEKRECGVFGATHVCFELVASNKKGIEVLWERETGVQLNAIEIEKRFTQNGADGDVSLALYDYSATMIAHLSQGLAHAFAIDLSSTRAAVIGHGGAFKFPGYGQRVQQIINHTAGSDSVNLLLTNSYSKNACLDGAALCAAIQ